MKTIWMAWLQGENHKSIPALNSRCIARWRELNSDYTIVMLTHENINDYVPEFNYIISRGLPARESDRLFKNNPNAFKTDILRMLILNKYGGIWVDTSVWPEMPLSSFYDKIMNQTGFFAYRFMPRGSYKGIDPLDNRKMCEVSVWFICADKPQHPLIQKWKDRLVERFLGTDQWFYFTFSETLTELYDTDTSIKTIVDSMVQIDEKIPHSACKSWTNRVESYMYKRPNINL